MRISSRPAMPSALQPQASQNSPSPSVASLIERLGFGPVTSTEPFEWRGTTYQLHHCERADVFVNAATGAVEWIKAKAKMIFPTGQQLSWTSWIPGDVIAEASKRDLGKFQGWTPPTFIERGFEVSYAFDRGAPVRTYRQSGPRAHPPWAPN